MVRVKRGGVFVSVPEGRDVSTISRGGGGFSPRREAQQNQINKILADMRAGNISQSDAAAQVKRVQRGGGSGAAADPSKFKRATETIQKFNLKQAQEEAAAKLESVLVQREFKKILDARARIIARGGSVRVRDSTDFKTRDKLKITSWNIGGNTVRRVENLTRGITTYNSFAPGRGGGSVRLQSGVTKAATPKDTTPRITPSDEPGKNLVTLSNGVKFKISNKGRVVVGARLAGERLEFFDGKLIRDLDKFPAKEGFNLTSSEEIEIRKLLPNRIELIKDSSGLIIGTRDRVTGRREDIASIDKFIEEKSVSDLKAQGRLVESFTNISKRWSSDISTTKSRLTNASKNRELDRLIELQNLGSNLTTEQRNERKRLEKRTAENYKLGGDLVGKVIGVTLINMGLGGRQLLIALKNNPQATLAALPSNVYEGVRLDFNRVMSGDPLEIAQVGVEYYTLGKVFRFLGKAGKTVFKVPVSIGRTLSPKYFSSIGKKLLIPPATLRGVIGKTAVGIRVGAIMKASLKKAGRVRRINSFVRNLKKSQSFVNRRIEIINKRGLRPIRRKFKEQVKLTKTIKELEIKKFKSQVEFSKQLKNAKRIRRLARKKGRTISVGNDEYLKAVAFIEEFADDLAKSKARKIIEVFKKRGGKLGLGQAEEIIKIVQKDIRRILDNLPDFKKLKSTARLNKPFQIKLRKTGKITSAKKLFKRITSKIEMLPLTKRVNSIIARVGRGLRRVKGKVKKGIKKARVSKELEIKKFKSQVEFSKQLKNAKRIRRLARKKGRTISVGNDEYLKAVAFIEEFADDLAKSKARRLIKEFKKRGGKLGLGQEDEIIRIIKKNVRRTLDNLADFKKLKNTARLNKPFQIKLRKIGKITSAKRMFRKLTSKIERLPVAKQINSIIARVGRRVRKVKRKISPKRRAAAKRIKRLRKGRLVAFKKTNRYRMERSRPIRKVTIGQLERSRTISQMNKFVDEFFDEVGRRQKVDISTVKFKQLKNLIKKRLRRAIKSGDRIELRKFSGSIKKIIDEMNRPINNPVVRVIEKTGKPRRFRTIRDFKPETPKGRYVEVKSGQQVLLQQVKQVQKAKVVQRLAQQEQVFVIQSVAKKSISLSPLVKFAIDSIFTVTLKSLLKIKPNQRTRQISKTLQASAQDFKTLQAAALAFGPRLNVAQAVAQRLRSGTRTRQKKKVKQVEKKKPTIRPRIPKKFSRKTLSRSVPVFFVKVKRRGRIVSLNPRPLTMGDARDFLAYRIDLRLSRSAWFEPMGKSKKVISIPAKMKGYFSKVRHKLRPFKIKVGKKKAIRNGYIEKSRFGLDKNREVRELALARKKARAKRKSLKRKPTKRKQTKKKVARGRPSRKSIRRNIVKIKKKPRRRKSVKKKPTKKKVARRKPNKRKQAKRKRTKRKVRK